MLIKFANDRNISNFTLFHCLSKFMYVGYWFFLAKKYHFLKLSMSIFTIQSAMPFEKYIYWGKLLLLPYVLYVHAAYIQGHKAIVDITKPRWIIKTTTNIFDIMRKHNQSKAWLEKLMDYNNVMYTLSNYITSRMCISPGIFI